MFRVAKKKTTTSYHYSLNALWTLTTKSAIRMIVILPQLKNPSPQSARNPHMRLGRNLAKSRAEKTFTFLWQPSTYNINYYIIIIKKLSCWINCVTVITITYYHYHTIYTRTITSPPHQFCTTKNPAFYPKNLIGQIIGQITDLWPTMWTPLPCWANGLFFSAIIKPKNNFEHV